MLLPTWKIESLTQVPLDKNQKSLPPLVETPSLALIRKQLSQKFLEATASRMNQIKKKRASSSEKIQVDPSKYNSYLFCPPSQQNIEASVQNKNYQNETIQIDPIDLDCSQLGLNDFESVYNIIVDFSNKNSFTKYDFQKLNIRSIDLSGNEMNLFFKENNIKNVQERFKKIQKLKSVLSLNLLDQKQKNNEEKYQKDQNFKQIFEEIHFLMPNLQELFIDIPFEQNSIVELFPGLKQINNVQMQIAQNEIIDKENLQLSESSQATSIKRQFRKNRQERAKSREFLSKQKFNISPAAINQQLSILDQSSNQTIQKLEMSHFENTFQQNQSNQSNNTTLNQTETTQMQETLNKNINMEDNNGLIQINYSQLDPDQISGLSSQIFPQTEVPCPSIKLEQVENYFQHKTSQVSSQPELPRPQIKPEKLENNCNHQTSQVSSQPELPRPQIQSEKIENYCSLKTSEVSSHFEAPRPQIKSEKLENNFSHETLDEYEQFIMQTQIKSSPLIINEEGKDIIKQQGATLSEIAEEESEHRNTFASRNISLKFQKTTSMVNDCTFSNESNKVYVGEIVISVNSSPNSIVKQIGQGIKNKEEELISRPKNEIESLKNNIKQEINQESETTSNQSTPQNNKQINFRDEIETVTKIDKILLVNTAVSQQSSNNLTQTNIITRPFNLSNKENNTSNICELLLRNVKKQIEKEQPVQIQIPEKDLFTMRGILERIRILQLKCAVPSDSKKQLILKNSSKKAKDSIQSFESKIDEMIKQLIYNASMSLSTSQYRQKDLEGQMYKIYEWINDQAIVFLKQQKGFLGQKDAFELSIILQKIQEEKDRIFQRMHLLFENKDEIELKKQALTELKRMNERCEELENQYDKYVELVNKFKFQQQEIQQQSQIMKVLQIEIVEKEDQIQKQNYKLKVKDNLIAEKDHQLSIIENRYNERLKTKDSEIQRNKTKVIKHESEIQKLKENEIKYQISQLDQRTLEKRILNLEMSKKQYQEELQTQKKSQKSKEYDIQKLTQLVTILKSEANEMREEGELLYEDHQSNLNFIAKLLPNKITQRDGSQNQATRKIKGQSKEMHEKIKQSPVKQINFEIENEIKWIKKQIQGRFVTTKRIKLFDKNHNYNSLIKSFELEQKSLCSPTSSKAKSLSQTTKNNSFFGKPKSSSIISRRSKMMTQILAPDLGSDLSIPKIKRSSLIEHYNNIIKNNPDPKLQEIDNQSLHTRNSQLIQQSKENIGLSNEAFKYYIKTNRNTSKYPTTIQSRRPSSHGFNQRMKSSVLSDCSQNQESGYSKIMSDRKLKMGCYYRKTSQQGSTCKRCLQRAEDSQHQQSENFNFQFQNVCSSQSKDIQIQGTKNFDRQNYQITANQDDIFKKAINKIDISNAQVSRLDSVDQSVYSKNQIHFELFSQNQRSERAFESAIRDDQSKELKSHADTANKKLTRISSQVIQDTATKDEILPLNECWKSYKARTKSLNSEKDSQSVKASKRQKQTKKSFKTFGEPNDQIQQPIILQKDQVNQARSSRRQRDQRSNPFKDKKNTSQLQQNISGTNPLISPLTRQDYHQFFRENSSVAFGYPYSAENDEGVVVLSYPGCYPVSCPASRPEINTSIISADVNTKEIEVIKDEPKKQINIKQIKPKQATQLKSKLQTKVIDSDPTKKKLKFIKPKEVKSQKKKNVRSKSGNETVKKLLIESENKKTRWDSVIAPTRSSKMKTSTKLN